MTYEQEILRILTQAGDKGLKTEKIAMHVFNACNSIFMPLDFQDVRMYVAQYLQKNAKAADSVIERGVGQGVYRLNLKSEQGQQISLQFAPHDEDRESTEEEKANMLPDTSLSLF